MTGSLPGIAQPPRSKPPRTSSSGRPGACITPSSVRWLVTTTLLIEVPFRRAGSDPASRPYTTLTLPSVRFADPPALKVVGPDAGRQNRFGVPVARDLVAAGHPVTGIDISDVQIQRARPLVPGGRVRRADAATLRLPTWRPTDGGSGRR